MCNSSQKSASSSNSSKQHILTPSASSKSKSTTSSIRHGSRTAHSSSSSSQTAHTNSGDQQSRGEEAIKRYENEPRDYKSWVVEEYDTYQEQANEEHWDGMERDVEGVEWACQCNRRAEKDECKQ